MKKINVLKLLKEQGFKYVFFHPNRRIVLSVSKPELNQTGSYWNEKGDSLGYAPDSFGDWKDSIHEIDFQEPKKEVQKSLFEKEDAVYILSHSNNGSNNGTFGVSSKGTVIEFVEREGVDCIAVKLENGFCEVHAEVKISFTPFSIHEGGFSQVRPEPKPKKGDWGWFWDNDDSIEDGYRYAMIDHIDEKIFSTSSRYGYDNFSLKNPTQND